MSKLRFGIVGCGTAAVPICQAIATVPETELAHVQDVNAEMARDLGERYSVPFSTELNELLNDPAVDAVYIAVPHYLLAGLTKRALEANKHALVEKPVALTLADLDELIALAESNQLTLGVNYEMRFASCYPQARELVQAGAIGEIVGVKIQTLIDKKLSYWQVGYSGRATTAWRGEKDKAGGGVTLMNTSHLLDALWWVTGLNITRVSAERDALVAPVDVEDTLAAALRFDNGAIGSLFVGAHIIGVEAAQGFEIYGKRGTLRVPDPYSSNPLQVFLRESAGDIPANVWHTMPREPVDVFQSVIQAFAQAGFAKQPAPTSANDARRVLETVLGLYKAADERAVVNLNAV